MSGIPFSAAGFSAQLASLPAPGNIAATVVGPPTTPEQRIYFYSPDEWEQFILEWATNLGVDYFQLKRVGGSGDRGADVAGFLTDQQFEGEWDCFQCKHYEKALQRSDAWPEIYKMFKAVAEGSYSLPRRYRFLAPRGCGPTLGRLLSAPTELKAAFLAQFSTIKPLGGGDDPALVAKIKALAAATDFSMFASFELHEVLAVHKGTAYHAVRFAMPLPMRPAPPTPPASPAPEETRYLQQLLAVYQDCYGEAATSVDRLTHAKAITHLHRQRESFYSAEALRVFARDSVPPGTFEDLQADLFQGVIETHDRDFANGMERLTAVLEQATVTALTTNPLITVSHNRDKKGMCHQLANDDRLTWCDSDAP